jgi:parvulin-like peptidyl-prolyl isomerase
MSPLRKFILRLVIYGAVLLYIIGDLFVFHGPLGRRIERADPGSPAAIAEAKARGVVARVFNHQITRSQLDRALRERLWLEGKTPESLTPEFLKIARYAALDDLIGHELLRVKAKANAKELQVSDEEIEERMARFTARFESGDAMASAMKSQGIASLRDLRDRLAARIQQEKYVEMKIAPLAEVTEDDMRTWFEENQKSLGIPERVRVRHIFIPTLDHPPEEAKAKLDTALAELTAKKKDFATLAREVSEDPATRDSGGELGWMTRERLPVDFTAAVFPMPLNEPALIRTRLGWHLAEVTDRKAAEPRAYEQAKPEILAALEAVKRQQAVAKYRAALRQFETEKIDVYHDMMGE